MTGLIGDKRNIVQAFWLGFGKLSSFALAFISAAILSRFLTKEDYGTYKQVMYIYASFSLIFAAGLPETLTYFLPKLTKSEGKHLINRFETAFILLGLIFSLSLYFGSPLIASILKNPALDEALKIYAPIPLLLLPTFAMESIYMCEQKSYYLAMYTVISRITILCCITLPVIFYKANCLVALQGLVVSSFCMLIVAFFLIYKPYRGFIPQKSTLHIRDVVYYAIPLMSADLSLMLFTAADQFFISRYFGEVVFAEFANGFIQFPLATMVSGSVLTVLIPLFSKVNTPKGFEEAIQSWQNAIKKTCLLLYPLLTFCLFFATEIVVFIYGKDYANSAIYFRIILLSNFINVYPFLPILLALRKLKVYSSFYFLSAISIWVSEAIAIYFYPSPVTIAWDSIANTILLVIAFYIYIKYKLHITVFTKNILQFLGKAIIHSAVVLTIIQYTVYPFVKSYPPLIILMITFMAFYVLLILSSKLFKLDYWAVIAPLFHSLTNKKS